MVGGLTSPLCENSHCSPRLRNNHVLLWVEGGGLREPRVEDMERHGYNLAAARLYIIDIFENFIYGLES